MPRPCESCPFRRDAPIAFGIDRFEQLRATIGEPGREVGFDAPMFACHWSVEGDEHVCAGWQAIHGINHLGARLAARTGVIPMDGFEPGEDWPELISDYDEVIALKAGPPGMCAIPTPPRR